MRRLGVGAWELLDLSKFKWKGFDAWAKGFGK